MVRDFPHDYMHLVCLGVTKKLILLWLRGRDKRYRISSRQADSISEQLNCISDFIPADFSRKPRSLKEVDRWKATEFRLFLLYTGPVVLKGIVNDEIYNHFLSLHTAVRILCSGLCSTFNRYAQELLIYFVNCFQRIYGKSQMSFNIHGLLHLADDSARYGPLDSFSAFKFENKLYEFKRLLKSSRQPLQQLQRRLFEKYSKDSPIQRPSLIYTMEHNRQPLSKSLVGCSQYEKMVYHETVFTTKCPDSYCMLKDSRIVRLENIVSGNGQHIIQGTQLLHSGDLYSEPAASSTFQVFRCVAQSQRVQDFDRDSIACKCLVIPMSFNTFAVFPILHTRN